MLKVFTAFSGYDSQCLALKRAGIEFDLVGWSEIEPNAIKAHNALFPEYSERNYGDIATIDWSTVPDFELFTYSPPCQDFSLAGLQRGGTEGSGTRSSLLWECKRAIAEKHPKYLLMENVKNLVSEKFIDVFLLWQEWLTEQGYTNFAKVLNAKDYGIPQNRERIFLVSILGDAWFMFPDKVELRLKMRDMLDSEVDEKYYLSQKLVDCFESFSDRKKQEGAGFRFEPTNGGGVCQDYSNKRGATSHR